MCIKKRLGKYRNSEQQFNTCSAVSCIYWTADVITSSAVFFHNACQCTCPDSTLEYGKTVRAIQLTLAFMKRRGKKKATWTGKWYCLWWGRGSWKPESGLKSPYPLLQTLFTQLWPNCAKSDQKPGPTPDLPVEGSVIPGVTRACAHTNTHVYHRDQSTPQTGWEGRTQLQGCEGKQKGLGKTCCWAWNMGWLVYQGKLLSMQHLWAGRCSLTQPLLPMICQLILHSSSWSCFPWIL